MIFKKNVIKMELNSYPPYIIMGEPKVGKTTLFRDLVLHNYGSEDVGLLISFGDEEGYLALDKLQYAVAKEWDAPLDENGVGGFKQIVDETIASGIKIVGLDTFDKMVEICTKEVLKLSRRETGVSCKSINDAFGGFQRGRDRLIQLILDQVGRLRNAGIAVFVIAHTKTKEKKDPFSGEAFEQITNNLRSDIYGCLANIAQMIVNIAVERTIEEGRVTSETRYMYFRSSALVDAGGRFTLVPDKLPLSAENFMKAFEMGVKGSFLTPKSEEELQAQKEKEGKALEELSKNAKEKETALPSLIKEIKKAMKELLEAKTITNSDILSLLKEYGLTQPNDITSTDEAKEILQRLHTFKG